jgi:hypothetical protein
MLVPVDTFMGTWKFREFWWKINLSTADMEGTEVYNFS